MTARRKIPYAITIALGGCLLVSAAAANAERAATATQVKARQVKERHPVLLISIDGMAPETIFKADSYGLKIPVLRSFLKDGSYAERVINVNPTVTSPNHISLVTGVSPRVHGIYNNRPFAPTAHLPAGYRLYANIKAPTLWHAAKAAGLRTGSLFWPVTDQSTDIDFNVLHGASKDDNQIARDAIAMIEKEKPELLTIHFVTFDSEQHMFGPNSPEGYIALERIDTAIGEIISAQRKMHPDTVIAIVSDHGFFKVTHQVHLNAALVHAGLITMTADPEPEVKSWLAFAWYVGGTAMIVLKDPRDMQTRERVKTFLQELAANPESGIARVYSGREITKLGLAPEAAFVLALKSGYRMGNAMTGPLRESSSGGAHGAFTTRSIRPDMHSSFLISGPNIPAGKSLGTVDIRQIAPTLAAILNVPFASAAMPSTDLKNEYGQRFGNTPLVR